MPTRQHARRHCTGAAVCLGALLAGSLSAGADQVQPAQVPLVLPRDLALTAHTGAPFPLCAVPGKVTLLAFGCTQCPDVKGPEPEVQRLSSSLRARFTVRGDVARCRRSLHVDVVCERVAALLDDSVQGGQRGPSTR